MKHNNKLCLLLVKLCVSLLFSIFALQYDMEKQLFSYQLYKTLKKWQAFLFFRNH